MLFDAGCVICQGFPGPVCRACEAALRHVPAPVINGVDVCRVGFELDDGGRTLVAALKYKKQRRLARWLGRNLESLVPRGADVLTWVPATPERRRMRGYDQAEELTKALSAFTGVPAQSLLTRSASDIRQTGQSRQERQRGPKLTSTCMIPDFVVLVDDVITTGSSLRVAAACLRGAGASRVVGVAAAAVPAAGDTSLHGLTRSCTVSKWT